MNAAVIVLFALAAPTQTDYFKGIDIEALKVPQVPQPSRSKKQEALYERCRAAAVKLPSSEGVRIAIRDCEKKFPPDVNPPRP